MKQAAHSLLELVIVLAIIGILSAIAVYNYARVLARVREMLGSGSFG